MKIIGPFAQIISLENLPQKGPIVDNQLKIYQNSSIYIVDGKIAEMGIFEQLIKKYPKAEIERIHLKMVLLPAFIDCHTHICYGGTRAKDFALRNSGIPYLEIAKQGGGISSTVNATREASLEVLTLSTLEKANYHLKNGVGTIEVKSGYGLNLEHEIKMLKAIKSANFSTKADLIPTCLSAHIKPKDFEGNTKDYLKYIENEIFPEVIKQNLAHRVDIFIEKTAFDVEESKAFLKNAKHLGFEITVHADQFSVGGSQVAIELGALSADHLEASTDLELNALAKSKTIGVALPGASIGLGEPFTSARKLLDFGGSLAIASDWNPGSAPQGNLLMQASILATYQKLSTAEVLAGLTFRAARALNLHDRGVLEKGKWADLQAYSTDDYREILYQQGRLKPSKVWKKGIEIF